MFSVVKMMVHLSKVIVSDAFYILVIHSEWHRKDSRAQIIVAEPVYQGLCKMLAIGILMKWPLTSRGKVLCYITE